MVHTNGACKYICAHFTIKLKLMTTAAKGESSMTLAGYRG